MEEKKERTLGDKLAKAEARALVYTLAERLKTLEVKELLYTLAEIQA